MFTPYTFSGSRIIDAQGSTLVYTDSNAADNGADERISVFADGAHVGTIRPGASVTMDRDCSRWELIPLSAAVLLEGTVHIGRGQFAPGTINGTVRVIDGELQRSIQAAQGMACIKRIGGAGVYPVVALQLYPDNFSLAVRSLLIEAQSAMDVAVWTAEVSAEPLYNERRALRNKLISIAPTQFNAVDAALLSLIDSTTIGTTAPTSDPTKYSNWQHWGMAKATATYARQLIGQAPIIIPPRYALVLVGQTAGGTLQVQADIEGLLT